MFPFIFDWTWTIDRLIFMGFLYLILTLVGVGLLTAFLLSLRNFQDLATGSGHGHDLETEAESGH